MPSQQANKPTQSYSDKHGIPKIPLTEALAHLEQALRHKRKRGVFCFVGDAGVGKTQGVHQVARKLGYEVVDFRTAQFSLLSAGVPQRATGDFFDIAVPSSMPRPGEKKILLFDEINQGTPQAVAMFFQLLEDRRLYNYQLPDDTVIVALMNPATSEYSVSRIESNSALNRRLKKFYVYSTYSDWQKYASTPDFHFSDGMAKPCHPSVLNFLARTPSSLYIEEERALGRQYPCPATWQTVSLDLYLQDQDEIPLKHDRTRNLVAATIGNSTADTFHGFLVKNETLLNASEVITGYKPRSKIRKAVLDELSKGGGEVARLQSEVPELLIAKKPPVAEVGPSFALFLADLAESAPARPEALYEHLQHLVYGETLGPTEEKLTYLRALTTAMAKDENFLKVNQLTAKTLAELMNPGSNDPAQD